MIVHVISSYFEDDELIYKAHKTLLLELLVRFGRGGAVYLQSGVRQTSNLIIVLATAVIQRLTFPTPEQDIVGEIVQSLYPS